MAMEFKRKMEPRYGEAVEVAPGIRRVTARNPGPFTFLGTNSYLVGTAALAVVDPGPEDAAQLAAILAAASGAKVAAILVTHSHRDHAPGARALQAATGAPIFAAAPHPPAAGGGGMDASFDRAFAPDHVMADGERISVADFALEAVATPGHTADHLAFALAGTSVLLSGDHVMAWSTTVVAPPDGSMADYMASLERLLGRPESQYLPGHGPELADARRFVKGLRAHRRMRERTILGQLAGGPLAIPDLVARIYRDLDPKLRGAAALSTLAQIEDLVGRGQVSLVAGAGMAGTYGLSISGTASGSSRPSPPRP